MLLLLRSNGGGLTDVSSALASVFEAQVGLVPTLQSIYEAGKGVWATKAETIFDDFNRADGAIGANWSNLSFYTNASVADNGVGASTTRASRYTATVFSDNHFAQARFRSLTSWGMVTVRGSSSGSFYAAGRNSNDTGNPNYFIYRFDNASTRVQLLNTGQATQVGDVFRLTVRDSLLTITVNGIDIGSVTDTTVRFGGSPGFTVNNGNSSVAVLDDFVGGDVGGRASQYEATGQVQSVSAPVVTDDFNRANSDPINGNWVKAPGTSANMKVISNEVGLSSNPGFQVHAAYYNNSYSIWPSNQYSQIKVTDLVGTDDYVGVIVRCAGVGWSSHKNYYFAHVRGGFGAAKDVLLGKYVEGIATTISSGTATIADNDTLRLEVEGTSLRFTINGSLILSGTDSSLSAGFPGFMMKQNSADPSNPNLDDWAGAGLMLRVSAYEAETGLGPTAISVQEATGDASRSILVPFEALSLIAESLVSVYESLEDVGSTPVDNDAITPFESLEGVAGASAKAYEALGSLTNDHISILEALEIVTQSRTVVLEALLGLENSAQTIEESTGTALNVESTSYEWVSSIVSSLTAAQEALENVARTTDSNQEANEGITASKSSAWESMVSVALDSVSNQEAIGITARELINAYEAGSNLNAAASTSFEALQVLQQLNQSSFEALSALATSSPSNYEAVEGLAGSFAVNYEAINGLIAEALSNYEAQGPPGEVFTAAVSPYEAIWSTSSDRTIALESLTGQDRSLIHSFEAGVNIARSIITAYEAGLVISRQLDTPVESSTLISTDYTSSFEAAKSLVTTFDSTIEALQVLASARQTCIEAIGIVSSAETTPVESGMAMTRALASVYEGLALVSKLASSAQEASVLLSSTTIAAYEAITILDGSDSSPWESSIALSQTTVSLQEALTRTVRDLAGNIEAAGLVQSSRSHPVEAITNVSRILDSNYEGLAKLVASAVSRYESMGAIGIALQILYGRPSDSSGLYSEKRDTIQIPGPSRDPFYKD
jgi:hypothetical protein